MASTEFALNMRPAGVPLRIRTSNGTCTLNEMCDIVVPHPVFGLNVVEGVYHVQPERLPRECKVLLGRRACASQCYVLLDLCDLPLTDEDTLPLFPAIQVTQPANAVVHSTKSRTLPVIWKGDSRQPTTLRRHRRIPDP